ncbi:MAG: hypothetical protein HPZ91_00040 [Lentisphaeria bacterium]|nr:hypothetical protein [Lentisphaeria bacterium]
MNDLQSLITEMTVVGGGVLCGERMMPEFMQALRVCLRAAEETEPLIYNVLFFTEERFVPRQAVLSADLLDADCGTA